MGSCRGRFMTRELRIAFVVLAIVASVCLSSPLAAQVADDRLVVPGQRIGAARLDMTIDDVINLYGTPSSIHRNFTSIWANIRPADWYVWKPVALVAATRDRVKIEYLWLDINVDSMRTFKTEQGIGRDTALEVFLRAYGQPTARTTAVAVQGVTAYQWFIYNTGGLFAVVMVLGEPRSVFTLGVFRPGEARNHWRF